MIAFLAYFLDICLNSEWFLAKWITKCSEALNSKGTDQMYKHKSRIMLTSKSTIFYDLPIRFGHYLRHITRKSIDLYQIQNTKKLWGKRNLFPLPKTHQTLKYRSYTVSNISRGNV